MSRVKDSDTDAEKHDSKEIEHDRSVDDDEQPLLSHLIALRRCLLRSFIAVGVIFVPMAVFANEIYAFVAAPIIAHLPNDGKMIATEVASPFLTPFKLAAYAALFVAIPYVLHQIWSFVAPGLYLREKKFASPLLISSVLLFYLGMVFAYFVVFPLVFAFFAATTPEGVTWMADINSYLGFVVKLFLAFGIVFEIPIATMLLILAGFTTPDSLAKKRPYVIVGCFVIGMVLTPPDVISQVLLAIPSWILFELGIILSRLIIKRRPKES